MSTTYKIRSGDTLENISKQAFGTEIHASHIARANPGLNDIKLTPGTNIVIPDLPGFPSLSLANNETTIESSIQIFIDGVRFEFWQELAIKKSIDNITTISFSMPFDPNAPGFKETFTPFTYKRVKLFVGTILFFTGVIISIRPSIDDRTVKLVISSYSLPGVLHDCTSPANAFPLEFLEAKLDVIVKSLLKPFGIGSEFLVDVGPSFDSVAINPAERVQDFIAKLARKRNIVITSTSAGLLRFWQSKEVGVAVANLQIGSSPVLDIVPSFNEQEFYSHVTGISFVFTGIKGAQHTEKNTFLNNVVRPFSFNVTDTNDIDLVTAVKAKVGRMFANMVSYSVSVSTWKDSKGDLWEPNTTIELLAPEIMVYKPYKFIIRSVEFIVDADREMATLELILPGGLNGKLPETLPWDL